MMCAAALAVTAAMALYVSSASAATVLCSQPESVCKSSNILPAGSYLAAAVNTEYAPDTSFTVQPSASSSKLTCTSAALGAKSTAISGNPLSVTTEKKNPWGCTLGSSTSIESAELNAPPGKLSWINKNNGLLELGTAAEHFRFTFTVVPGITCTYGNARQEFYVTYDEVELEGHVKPWAFNPELKLEAGNSFLCGGEKASLKINEDFLGVGGYVASN
jgi:hypothetical protein